MKAIPPAIQTFVEKQDGLVTLRDLNSTGLARTTATRRVEAGVWTRLHRGVYLTTASKPTPRQRARAALLYAGPQSALSHEAAAWGADMSVRLGATIDVSVPHTVQRSSVKGVRLHRRRRMPVTQGRLRRTEVNETVLDLCQVANSEDEVIGWIAEGMRRGASTDGILLRLESRPKYPARRQLLEFLGETKVGIESPMEYRFRHNVLIAHELPLGTHQVPGSVRGKGFRSDWREPTFGIRAELDGEHWHSGARADADHIRDNDVLAQTGDETFRFLWHDIVRPCLVAGQLAIALRRRGWDDYPRLCGPDCTLWESAVPHRGFAPR